MKPLSRSSFTASPASLLWPGGRPVWLVSVLGVAVGLSAAAVPFLPALLSELGRAPALQSLGPPAAVDVAGPPPSIPLPGKPYSVAGTATGAVTPTRTPRPTATPQPTTTPTRRAAVTTEPPAKAETTTRRAAASTTPEPDPTQAAPVFTPLTTNATDPQNTRVEVSEASCAPCASGSRIIYLAGPASLTVPVRNVPVAGPRTLSIVYETNGIRDLFVSVNGAAGIKLSLPGADSWEAPVTTSLSIDLNKGNNTIKFHNPDGPAPDLDQFRIS